MAEYKFGFIGSGNMGGALARAAVKQLSGENVIISDKCTEKAQALACELGCAAGDTREIAQKSQYIFMGVKPQVMAAALSEISDILASRKDRFILVTMAAGIKITAFNEMLGAKYPIIRIMPNTPVGVGKGMILFTTCPVITEDEVQEFCDALSAAGRIDRIDEKLIDAASAVSGCGPAFVYMFAEAMADAGVECGLPRDKALLYASQTLAGAAELLLTSAKHPGTLKDEVCSPGGSTIAGVHALEENGFRGSVINAIEASFQRTKELGK